MQRHGVSRLPIKETREQSKRFKSSENGYVHIDSCEFRHAKDGIVMLFAINWGSKFNPVELHESAGKMEGESFLRTRWRRFPPEATSS